MIPHLPPQPPGSNPLHQMKLFVSGGASLYNQFTGVQLKAGGFCSVVSGGDPSPGSAALLLLLCSSVPANLLTVMGRR